MTISKQKRSNPYELIAQSINQPNLLGRFFDLPDIGLSEEGSFSVDIKEHDDCYKIVADIPGFKKEDVAIDMENNLLTISARKSASRDEEENGKFIRRERTTTSYSRSFHLPKHIADGGVSAKLENGVLELTLPKAPESAKKKIAVE